MKHRGGWHQPKTRNGENQCGERRKSNSVGVAAARAVKIIRRLSKKTAGSSRSVYVAIDCRAVVRVVCISSVFAQNVGINEEKSNKARRQ